jgi:hypothetical protein
MLPVTPASAHVSWPAMITSSVVTATRERSNENRLMRVISSLDRVFSLRNLASYKAEESVTRVVTFNRLRC